MVSIRDIISSDAEEKLMGLVQTGSDTSIEESEAASERGRYVIQILDESSNKVMYFDRVKTSYGGFRIITTSVGGKRYFSKAAAESDAKMIQEHYPENCIVEVVDY